MSQLTRLHPGQRRLGQFGLALIHDLVVKKLGHHTFTILEESDLRILLIGDLGRAALLRSLLTKFTTHIKGARVEIIKVKVRVE